MILSKKYWRLFLVAFFTFVFGLTLLEAFYMWKNSPAEVWRIGDWLINFQGGLVRRGLPGELFLRLSHLMSVDLILVVVFFQVLFSFIFLTNTCRLFMNSSFSVFTAALILSPAFVLFPVLESRWAFRKEILFFVLLSSLCGQLIFSRNVSRYLPIVIGICSALIALSHEMLIVYFPYLICAVVLYEGKFGINSKRTIAAILPAIMIGLLIAAFGNGNEQVVRRICDSTKAYALRDCVHPDAEVGAITFLAKDLSFAHNFVLNTVNKNILTTCVFLIIFGFAPLLLIFFSKKFSIVLNQEARAGLVIFLLLAILGSIPLLWIVADYARIIYIHVTCLSLLALMTVQERDTPWIRTKQNYLPTSKPF